MPLVCGIVHSKLNKVILIVELVNSFIVSRQQDIQRCLMTFLGLIIRAVFISAVFLQSLRKFRLWT